MPLNAGVLIIGSLLWDSELGRVAWRNARLDIASLQTVTASIRYGRLSMSRGDTYTMVFSRKAGTGQGKVLRCVRAISTPADLNEEAEALWKAEQPTAGSGRVASGWGCVALLCSPDRKVPADLLRAWTDRIGREQDYGMVTQTEEEGRQIDENGQILIDWPRLVDTGEPVQLDLLLVTANDPVITASCPSYPEPARIAEAWNATASKYAEYFWKNAENGIRTFQDAEILASLRPRGQERR